MDRRNVLRDRTDDVHADHPGRAHRSAPVPQPNLLRGGDVPLSRAGVAQLQRLVGNQAAGERIAQRTGAGPVIQRDSYPYGSGNVVPHIHQYGSGAHIKILDRGKIRRIDLVKNGSRDYEAVAEAFDLVRATGNTVLLGALKTVLAAF